MFGATRHPDFGFATTALDMSRSGQSIGRTARRFGGVAIVFGRTERGPDARRARPRILVSRAERARGVLVKARMLYAIEVNGRRRDVDAPAGASLLTVLRDSLGLTGARFGCGHGSCGACVVLADGAPVPACTTKIEDVGARAIVTIEGLARDGELHRVQRAFLEEGALQCGYCTSGMILAAAALLERTPTPSEDEIRSALATHLCRCGVYVRAIRAVERASR